MKRLEYCQCTACEKTTDVIIQALRKLGTDRRCSDAGLPPMLEAWLLQTFDDEPFNGLLNLHTD